MVRHGAALRAKTFSGRRASQSAEELAAFIAFLKTEKVTAYGEIGARDGDTFHAVMNSLPPKSKGVALDLPGGPWGKESTRSQLEKCVSSLKENGYAASCLFGDSRTEATSVMFKGRGPYDVILIDGDHRLEGVTADWMNYRSSARIVAFHDIDGEGEKNSQGEPVQVHLLWKSIRDNYRTQEFIVPGTHMGIGVVWNPEN